MAGRQPEINENDKIQHTSFIETMNSEETTNEDEVSLQQVYLHNLKFGLSPSFKMVGQLYK